MRIETMGYGGICATPPLHPHSVWRLRFCRIVRRLQVPLCKLDRVKNIARSSLVTLPKFIADQQKYKAMLRQIGRLNGILPEHSHLRAGPKQALRRRAKRSPRIRRLTLGATEPHNKSGDPVRRRTGANTASSKWMPCSQASQTSPPHAEVGGDGRTPTEDPPDSALPARYCAENSDMRRVCSEATTRMARVPSHQETAGKVTRNDILVISVDEAAMAKANTYFSPAERSEHPCEQPLLVSDDVAVQPPTQERHNQCRWRNGEIEPTRPHTLPPSLAGSRGRLHLHRQSELGKSADSLFGVVSQRFLP